ncbi:hypothetical protein IKZ80_04140 [bacterium]|nr:hypothetical protein [bacterium]
MQLIFQPNTKESRILQIKGTAATIGSASENIICLPTAFPYHIGLYYLEGAWFADDISGKGFVLDGKPAATGQLRIGSRLKAGDCTLLVINTDLIENDEKGEVVFQQAENQPAPKVEGELVPE